MLDLSRLSVAQRAAVMAADGPLQIVAGPGSGKTTVLAARIAYLVTARQVSSTSILAVTFATKAARELRSRLADLLGSAADDVDVSTFHAFGLRVIRQWSEVLGWDAGRLSVYDQDAAYHLLHDVAGELDFDDSALHELAGRFERYRLAVEPRIRDASGKQLALLAERYEEALRRRGAIDYPAMLALPLRLFAARPETLRLLQDSYRHVLCDEFQDVCPAQYQLLQLLAERHRNLIVVGDPMQALYAWRGADVRLLRRFERDFPEARLINLDQNFRSTGRLVDLANALAAPLPYARKLWTENPSGDPARLHVVQDEKGEAAFVAGEIARLRAEGLVENLSEIAVLYRTNQQAPDPSIALRAHGVPYRVRGTEDLFRRREVLDAVAYLRLAHTPADADALARIVNVPPRRLGRIAEALRVQPTPLDQLPELAQRCGPAAVAAAHHLADLITEFHARSTVLAPAPLLDFVLERSGYRAWLSRQPDGEKRLANLASLRLLAAATAAELGEWLTELQLDDDPPANDDVPRVTLTTIHGAKGGEWRRVFVLGVEEGLLPHAHALTDGHRDRDGIEAERRVAYVAMTRAREGLYLLCCRSRRRRDLPEPRRPSRFLQCLPLERVA